VQTLKSRFGVIGAIVPSFIAAVSFTTCLDLSRSAQEAETNGLGPTMLGLGAVSLLFSIPLIMKVVRIFAGPRSPGSGPGRVGAR